MEDELGISVGDWWREVESVCSKSSSRRHTQVGASPMTANTPVLHSKGQPTEDTTHWNPTWKNKL